MRQKSLLSKNLTQFVTCLGIIFLLAVPLFYLLTKTFYAEEMADILAAVRRGDEIGSQDLEEDIMIGMMLQFILIFVIISVALLLTIRLLTRKLWKPFDKTLAAVENFDLTNNEMPHFDDGGTEEFARLNRSLTQLLSKNRETYRIHKEFTENASHELQTPLAIARGKLDILMQENLDEQAIHIISDLYSLNVRMEHLNRNLLLLARIENKQYSDMRDTDIVNFVRATLPNYESLHTGITMTVDNDVSSRLHHVRCNVILLECVLNNLVINAIQHTPDASGKICVKLAGTCLSVANSSDGNALDAQTLFVRFRKGSVTSKGNGLGLYIVKAICDFHEWKAGYSFINNEHVFTIDFRNG